MDHAFVPQQVLVKPSMCMQDVTCMLWSCGMVRKLLVDAFHSVTNLSGNEQLGLFLVRTSSDDQLQCIDLDPWVRASYPAPHAICLPEGLAPVASQKWSGDTTGNCC